MLTADDLIKRLALEEHIEGGYFKEVYRNRLSPERLNNEFLEQRGLCTIIYYLLKSGQVSKFHRLTSDEIWFYHQGSPMLIHTIDSQGNLNTSKLGINLEQGESPQVLIQANLIFAAEVSVNNSFSLVSCLVSPGFSYQDFEVFKTDQLIEEFPQHRDIILRFK